MQLKSFNRRTTVIIFISVFVTSLFSSQIASTFLIDPLPSSKDIIFNSNSTERIFTNKQIENLTLIGRFTEGEDRIEDVVTYNQYAIVANIYDSIKVLDVTDPLHPIKVFHDWPGGQWHDLEIVGTRLYTAQHGDGLQIYDISDPTNLKKYGILWMNVDPPYTNPQDVAIQGTFAYLADDFKGLQIIDVSDRSNPSEVGRFNDGGDAKGVAVDGSMAYVLERSGTLEIINISDPFNPIKVSSFSNGGMGNNIVVKDSIAYVADLMDGLKIFNVSNPSEPVLISSFKDGPGEANGVVIKDNFAYLADGEDGLEIIDISNLMIPKKIISSQSLYNATNVHVNDSLIYLAQEQGTIDIFEINGDRDPYDPSDHPLIPDLINGRVKHDPINIESNADFTKYNFPGNGKKENPYIIENLHISNNRTTLISISDTTAFFTIRNCILDGKHINFGGGGISLDTVENGYVVNNTITQSSQGIVLVYSSENIISGNVMFFNGHQGIFLLGANNNRIADNYIEAQDYSSSSGSTDDGVALYLSGNNELKFNTITGFRLYGIVIDSDSAENAIVYNNFIDNYENSLNQASDDGLSNNFSRNFWDNWITPDADENGIVDSPYPITGNTEGDLFPLTKIIKHTLSEPQISFPNSAEIVSGLVQISWIPSEDSYNFPITYEVDYSTDGIFWVPIVRSLINTNIAWDTTEVLDCMTYLIRVIASSETGLSSTYVSQGSFIVQNSPCPTSNTTSNSKSTSNSQTLNNVSFDLPIILICFLFVLFRWFKKKKGP